VPLRRHDQDNGLVGSMGRGGACGGNAAMESFFALLQKASSTANAGRLEKNYGWRSAPGSNAPTTADAGNGAWDDDTHRIRETLNPAAIAA
jgi:hypothetical protein